MKKPSRLVMVLALCLLLSTSYGIRLPQESKPSTKIEQMSDVEKPNTNDVKATIICQDNEHCASTPLSSSSSSSSSGKYRKLMTPTISSSSTVPSTTISSKSSSGANKSTSSSLPLEYSESTPAKYKDVDDTDITEMDYSHAQRKAPIHN